MPVTFNTHLDFFVDSLFAGKRAFVLYRLRPCNIIVAITAPIQLHRMNVQT
jgi:hypothetical protein